MEDEKEGMEYILLDDYGRDLIRRATGQLARGIAGMWTILPQPEKGQFERTLNNGGRLRGQIVRLHSSPRGLKHQMTTDGEYASLDEKLGDTTLFDVLNEHHRGGIGGTMRHYNWPHKQTEGVGLQPDVKAAFLKRIEVMCKDVPFKVDVLGCSRRFLLGFSPGGVHTQTSFLTLAPVPQTYSPFNEEGKLSSRYRDHFPPELCLREKAAGRRVFPEAWRDLLVSPLLYRGPAWAIRFLLDEQDCLQENRVWLTDDLLFIQSDWCQRHNYSTYGNGADFVNQEFDLASWINMALSKKAIRDRLLKPKSTTIKHYALRDLLKLGGRRPFTWGPIMKAIRDCMFQQDILGEYEKPVIEGTEFDALRLAFRAPLSRSIVNKQHTLGPTIPKGSVREWMFASTAGDAHTHVIGPREGDHGVWRGSVRYTNFVSETDPTRVFEQAFRGELDGYPEHVRIALNGIMAEIYNHESALLYAATTKQPLGQRDRDFDIVALWKKAFSPEGLKAGLVLAGVDERDLNTGRAQEVQGG